MVIEGEVGRCKNLHLHIQRCYIFGIVVKEGEIAKTDQQQKIRGRYGTDQIVEFDLKDRKNLLVTRRNSKSTWSDV